MMPLAIDEFGGSIGGGNFSVFAADSQPEPQAPDVVGPADCHETAVISVLDAENRLLAVRLYSRLDPRADRGSIERAQLGIRGNADDRSLRAKLNRLADLPLDVIRLSTFGAGVALGRSGGPREGRYFNG